MIPLKTPQQIKVMAEGGYRLAKIFDQVLAKAKPGVKLMALEKLASKLIKQAGGQASFKKVKGYHWATCLDLNEGVVHGIPDQRQLKKGDLFSLDMGFYYQGWHTDMATTIKIRHSQFAIRHSQFLKVGKRALTKAIDQARPSKRVGHISQVIEGEIKKAGFRPVRILTGHGIGRELHEEPQIPCFLAEPVAETDELKPGMTLAIEVIYAQGKSDLKISRNGWTFTTKDKSLAGLFEHTVAVTNTSPQILTI